jgi:hypothetical protein
MNQILTSIIKSMPLIEVKQLLDNHILGEKIYIEIGKEIINSIILNKEQIVSLEGKVKDIIIGFNNKNYVKKVGIYSEKPTMPDIRIPINSKQRKE